MLLGRNGWPPCCLRDLKNPYLFDVHRARHGWCLDDDPDYESNYVENFERISRMKQMFHQAHIIVDSKRYYLNKVSYPSSRTTVAVEKAGSYNVSARRYNLNKYNPSICEINLQQIVSDFRNSKVEWNVKKGDGEKL